MNLRQLEYFLAIARTGSITGAAAELGVAQPTLTKSLRALEEELGVALFERLPRGVAVTEFGRSLLRHAETVNIQLRDAVREIDSLRGGTSGTVAIGAGPAWLRRHLPLAVARTLELNPAMRVRVDGGFDDALLRELRQGEVDFVVAELPSPVPPDLEAEPLTSDSLGVVCRRGHPLAGDDEVPIMHLLDFPWVSPPQNTRAQQRLRALFMAMDLPPPDPVMETESMAFLIQLVRNSNALTFTVSTTLRIHESENLVMLNTPQWHTTRRAGIISRKDSWLSPAALAIIGQLRTICADEPTN